MLLPFTLGRNILDVTLLTKGEIYGYSLYDVKYFFPFYLSDVFLLLIYQNYFSKKIFKKQKDFTIPISFSLASLFLSIFICLTALNSINHEFGQLIIFSSITLIKFLLIFLVTFLIDLKKRKSEIIQIIVASTLFQSLLIIAEQIRGGNIGKFIESTLPGIEIGTGTSEASDVLRANGTFNEPNVAAIFLLVNICIILPISIKKIFSGKQISNYFYVVVLLLSLLAIVFTGSRSLYFLTVIVFIYNIFRYKTEFIKIYQIFSKKNVVKIFIVTILISIFPYLINRIDTIKDVLTEKGSFSYRRDLNNYSLQLAQNKLLGIGINMSPYYLAKNFKTVDSTLVIFDQAPAHNIFIQVFTETGILGLTTFLLFLYFSFKGIYSSNHDINYFYIAAIVYLMAAQFHPVFTTHLEIFCLFLLYLSIANNIQLRE